MNKPGTQGSKESPKTQGRRKDDDIFAEGEIENITLGGEYTNNNEQENIDDPERDMKLELSKIIYTINNMDPDHIRYVNKVESLNKNDIIQINIEFTYDETKQNVTLYICIDRLIPITKNKQKKYVSEGRIFYSLKGEIQEEGEIKDLHFGDKLFKDNFTKLQLPIVSIKGKKEGVKRKEGQKGQRRILEGFTRESNKNDKYSNFKNTSRYLREYNISNIILYSSTEPKEDRKDLLRRKSKEILDTLGF